MKRRTAWTGRRAPWPERGPRLDPAVPVSAAVAGTARAARCAPDAPFTKVGGLGRYAVHERGLFQHEVVRGNTATMASGAPAGGSSAPGGARRRQFRGPPTAGARSRRGRSSPPPGTRHAASAPTTTVRSAGMRAPRAIQRSAGEASASPSASTYCFGRLVTAYDARQRPKANALTAGEDQAPQARRSSPRGVRCGKSSRAVRTAMRRRACNADATRIAGRDGSLNSFARVLERVRARPIDHHADDNMSPRTTS